MMKIALPMKYKKHKVIKTLKLSPFPMEKIQKLAEQMKMSPYSTELLKHLLKTVIIAGSLAPTGLDLPRRTLKNITMKKRPKIRSPWKKSNSVKTLSLLLRFQFLATLSSSNVVYFLTFC